MTSYRVPVPTRTEQQYEGLGLRRMSRVVSTACLGRSVTTHLRTELWAGPWFGETEHRNKVLLFCGENGSEGGRDSKH